MVTIENEPSPTDGTFLAIERMERRSFEMEFHWLPIEKVDNPEVYPINVKALLSRLSDCVRHFVCWKKVMSKM